MLINLRNALMTGKRLPYDAEVEYLSSSENAGVGGTTIAPVYIDTGVVLSSGIKMSVTGAFNSTAYQLMGCYGGTSGRFDIGINNSGVFVTSIGATSTRSTANTNIHEFVLDAPNAMAYIDGMGVATGTFSIGIPGNIILFSRGRGDKTPPLDYTAPYSKVNIKIYSCKIWDNGVLVRDFIPVRKGTVGYLYDRVSGKLFGNAGTGDFVVGPDVVPVEYLQGDGNAYIKTGVPCAFTDTYKVVAGYNENTRQSALFGAAWAARSVFLQMTSSPNDFYWHGMNPSSYHQFADGMNTIICGNGYITINGVTTTGSNYLNANEGNEIYLLGNRSFYGGAGPAKARVSNFTITSQGGDDKLRLLSVRVGTEGAMMDVLTRRIYRNAGTGAFGYGNDLKYPIPA